MTPDQLPAGLPMDNKIEAWVQQALQLADARELARANVAASTWSNEARERLARASNDLAAHLRTTPEGYRLAPVKPTAAMIAAGVAEADFYKTPTFQAEATYLAMLAASQESGT